MVNSPNQTSPKSAGHGFTGTPVLPSTTPNRTTDDRQTDHVAGSSPNPSSSLDTDETIVGFHPAVINGVEFAARTELHQNFRHSFWKQRREATLRAFRRLSLSDSKIDRFTRCGSASWVLRCTTDRDRFRLSTNACRDRWCEACAGEKRRTIVQNCQTALEGRDLRFLTLTLKSSDDSLSHQLNRLIEGFRRLRNYRDIRHNMKGGLYFVELQINRKTGRWHPHLHILFEGGFIAQRVLSDLWMRSTGDSYIVHIVRLGSGRGAGSYVAKYAGKSVPSSVWKDPLKFAESIEALSGRRLFSYFGDWRGLKLSKPAADDLEWEPVAPLFELIRRSESGERWCINVLSRLRGGMCDESVDLFDSG